MSLLPSRWLACVLAACAAAGARADEPVAPRLVVVISIDQFRYDYLDRFREAFGPDGFRRLREQGTDFRECHYRHAFTKTAPGHAVILSGAQPAVHGIVGNEWVNRQTWETIVGVEDRAAPLVGAPARALVSPGGVLEAKEGRSPRNFLAETVGDVLKARTGGKAKVIAVANKDRAAILLGGHRADGAYWFERGNFVTSQYYRPQLPAWVEAFNREGRVRAYFGRTWDRLLAPEIYERLAGPDAVVGEDPSPGLGVTFPHRVDGGQAEYGNAFLSAFPITPYYSEILAAFAKEAVRAEGLGRDDVTDLLCIGFSQIDYTGHSYGPDSQEIMDSIVRLDRLIAGLLADLDAEVGAGKYVVVFTADHGVAPLPELIAARQPGVGGRLDHVAITRAVERALDAAFGPLEAPLYWVTRDGTGFHLRPEALAAKRLTAAAAGAVVRDALRPRPEVLVAYTREDLTGPGPLDDLGERVRYAYHRERSPDVVYILRPHWVDRARTGTNHGTPHDYDDHVPLVWYGAGIPAAVRTERVGVDNLAPTLSNLLGLPRPAQAAGRSLF